LPSKIDTRQIKSKAKKRLNYKNPIFVMDELVFNPEATFMT
jgi:hypothetical protein